MRVGFIGLGKLGLPCATAIALNGHDVKGFDLDPSRMSKQPQPYQEAGPDGFGDFNDYLPIADRLSFGSCREVVHWAEILFVAVQTPHDPRYEGITRLPPERVDFGYSHLRQAISEIANYANHDLPLVIISTVLPGTMSREVLPLLKGSPATRYLRLLYNPFFIAMGTTMRDFLYPEFVLLGSEDDGWAADRVEAFYRISRPVTRLSVFRTSIENAELIKVAYNTFISTKIAFANTIMEACHRLPGCDVDQVTDVLSQARQRLISPAYLRGGMGDGGGCHPRDNIALSWLSRRLGLKFDFFEAMMLQREKGTEFLADLMMEHDLPKVILGTAFKAETNLTVGSPALLLKSILEERGVEVLATEHREEIPDRPCCILIGAKHERFEDCVFPEGSVVIDPWRYIPKDYTGRTRVIPVGIGPSLPQAGCGGTT